MDIKQLRYFLATAQYLNFTEAAKHLFIAQPALSRQIADLENYIGIPLFIRNKRGLQLTTAGMELLSEAREIVSKSEEALRKVKLAASGIVGSLKIGYLGTSEKRFLPNLIRAFRKRNPHVWLSVSRANWGILNYALNTGELDVVFTLTTGLENIPDLCWEKVYTEYSALVVSYDHPLANEKKVNMTDLAKEMFVLLDRTESPQLFDYIIKMCANSDFYPNIITQPHIDTVLLMVEAGLRITILSRHGKEYASPALRYIAINNSDTTVNLVMVWKANNSNPCIPLFRSELKKCMAASATNTSN